MTINSRNYEAYTKVGTAFVKALNSAENERI